VEGAVEITSGRANRGDQPLVKRGASRTLKIPSTRRLTQSFGGRLQLGSNFVDTSTAQKARIPARATAQSILDGRRAGVTAVFIHPAIDYAHFVIPAKAGIQVRDERSASGITVWHLTSNKTWIPAFAGMAGRCASTLFNCRINRSNKKQNTSKYGRFQPFCAENARQSTTLPFSLAAY